MIVDSSALVAVILREPGHGDLLDRMVGGRVAGVGAPTLAETGIVLTARLGVLGTTLLARLLHEGGMGVIPFDDVHWPVAVAAFTRFGKGRHSAGLNFGGCLTYAMAWVAGEPLLCVGDDFAKTDLALA
ncbi:MAG: type II toxin-antitoxin system VapC family toxin [Acidimicrobiales bacterium]